MPQRKIEKGIHIYKYLSLTDNFDRSTSGKDSLIIRIISLR